MPTRPYRRHADGQMQLALDEHRLHGRARLEEHEPMDSLDPALLDVRQVAAVLGCGRTLVFELLATGQLPIVKLGRLTRVPQSALREFVARRTLPAETAREHNRVSITTGSRN